MQPVPHLREETFNHGLGEALKLLRKEWRREGAVQIEAQGGIHDPDTGQSLRADILIHPPETIPVAVEVEFGDAGNVDVAPRRIGKETATGQTVDTAVEILVPQAIKQQNVPIHAVTESLLGGEWKVKYALHTSTDEGAGESERWPESGLLEGNVRDIAGFIQASCIPSHRVDASVARMAAEVDMRSEAIFRLDRQYNLGLGEEIAALLGQPHSRKAVRVAVCLWLNAIQTQNRIRASGCRHRNHPEQSFRSTLDLRTEFDGKTDNGRPLAIDQLRDSWKDILDHDHRSSFKPALDTLEVLERQQAAGSEIVSGLDRCAHKNETIGRNLHIAAEMFPRLAADRKETAAFYTRSESAALLAGLLLPSNDIESLWRDEPWKLAESGGRPNVLKVADFACGTGTLLRALYSRLRTFYDEMGEDPADYHRSWMEEGLHGTDIAPIAVHLTASGLTGMEIGQDYARSRLACLSMSGGYTGACELLNAQAMDNLFEEVPRHVDMDPGAPQAGTNRFRADHRSFDVIAMNPPYSRTHGGRAQGGVFGVAGVTPVQRAIAQRHLRKTVTGTFANMKAGLGSVFMLLADRKIRPGGRVGLVLPLTMTNSEEWREARRHLAKSYYGMTVVSIASDESDSFSADTDLGEILLIARKREEGVEGGAPRSVILKRSPKSHAEAHELARILNETETPVPGTFKRILLGGERMGTVFPYELPPNGDPWGGIGMRSPDLVMAAMSLLRSELSAPGIGIETVPFDIPMTRLGSLCRIGPTHHLIGHVRGNEEIGAFAFDAVVPGDVPSDASLWAANAGTQEKMRVDPTHEGTPLPGREMKVERMRACRTDLFWARGLRLTSQKLACVRTSVPCHGGRAWAGLSHESEEVKCAVALWANSTPGLILQFWHGQKQQVGRAAMQIKAVSEMPIPDFSADTEAAEHARSVGREAWEELQALKIMPLAAAWRDTAREKIDKAALEMIGANGVNIERLRKLWCREPGVHGGNNVHMKELGILKRGERP